jgi:glycosyltransferase involved in cell wall biosynthesis
VNVPRISVVVPFFNADQFLGMAIDSVVAQSFTDWELLLVDDGSSDESSVLARRLAQESAGKIRYLTHPGGANRGISASLNLGIRESAGDLVALLDSDDFWFPPKLEEQVGILDSHPRAAMVYGRTQFWYSWTGKPADQPRDRLERLGVPADSLVEPPGLLVSLLKREAPVPCPCSVLVRKEAVQGVGGFEETAVSNSHSDQSFYVKLFLTAPVFASGRCWARYRQHPDSSVAEMKRLGQRDREDRKLLEFLEGYVEASEGRNAEVQRVLQERLREIRYRTSSRLGRLLRDPARAAKSMIKRSVSAGALETLRRWTENGASGPSPGRVRFGDFRRLQPFDRRRGFERGLPIDRHYIEVFLEGHAADIRGRVLEIGDNSSTWRFGRDAVRQSDVLNVAPGDPKTTLVGALEAGDELPSGRFDCILFIETLHRLYDFRAGLRTLHRMLKPGGVLLATFPGITKTDRPEDGGTSGYWSFTPLSARRAFEEVFPAGSCQVDACGNVLAATAFLWGLAAEELDATELERKDPEYPVTLTVRARKPGGGNRRSDSPA